MQCRTVLTRIDAMRTGELESPEHVEVEKHLETCGSCYESVDDVLSFASRVKALSTAPTRSCLKDVAAAVSDRFDQFDVDGRTVRVAFGPAGIRMIDVVSEDEEAFRARYRTRFDRELCPDALSASQRRAIEAALHGERATLPPIDLSALSEFEQRVLKTITTIPLGEVRTYEWVARAAGRPRAVRAVGNIMAANPVPILLPCHRVVPTSGGVGRYAFGSEMKRSILSAEHAPVEELEQLGRKGVRYIGSRTTGIFCFPSCKDARRIREENRVPFRNASQALEVGFRPCKRCAPVVAA
jgi:O-6-methylguanine DNA methyltransferase